MRNGRAGSLVAAGALVVAAACGEADGTQVGDSEDRGRRVNVEVAAVEPRDFVHVIRVVGTVEAERDVIVSAEEGGVVAAVLVRQGDRVRPGQPLARLDGAVLRAQVEQAVSQAELAEETWTRQRRLWEDEGVGTEMAYLQAKYNARTARAQARVLAERYERTTVRAPIAGVIEERLVEVGSMVSPGARVARILTVDTVRIEAGVPERYAGEIRRGTEANVTLDRLAGQHFAGEVEHVGAAVDRSNRTFAIEVEVPNPGHTLKPGMVANIQLSRERVEEALVVPRHAVLRREAGYSVYVAVRNGSGWRAEERSVVPGRSRGDEIVIESGLRAGEWVVVVGQQRAAHGDILVITNPEVMTAAPATVEE